jgi:scyllo-inositol 2-dehydrogenase (NADP+)
MAKAVKTEILTGVVGYGGAFNMGMHHLNSQKATKGLKPVAVCDADPARAQQAKEDWPDLEVYTDLKELLKKSPVEMLTMITPHNTHAPLAIQCMNAGRHAITEKPMAISVKECDRMIAASKKNKVMLSVYHNRHWDANIIGLTRAAHRGGIGDVFRVDAAAAGYGKPRDDWWRSNKAVSGGYMYDWGAHFVEWLLQIMNAPMSDIAGYFQDRVWSHVTNEDEGVAVVRFKNGSSCRLEMSSIAATGLPYSFRILGTKGSVVTSDGGCVVTKIDKKGERTEKYVEYPKGQHSKFYRNIRDHLLKGSDLIITPEWARRVIQVIEYSELSHKKGKSVPAKYE